MALDSAGYNTQNAFSAGNALATGLQQAAVFDPTQQSTGLKTSVAGTLNSQNDLQQDGADAQQNMQSTPTAGTLSTASNNTAYPNWAQMLGGMNRSSIYTLAPTSNTNMSTQVQAQDGQAPSTTYNLGSYGGTFTVANPTSTVTTTNNALAAPNANAATRSNTLTDMATAGGPAVVNYRTSDGNFAYYKFNPTSGRYEYAATYDKNGAVVGGGQQYVDANGMSQIYTGLSTADRQNATVQQLGTGQTFKTQDAASQANAVTTANNSFIVAWQKANAAAASNNAATALTQQTASALAYMQANGGALPPTNAPGQTGAPQYSAEALAAAQAQYQTYLQTRAAEDANAALLGAYKNKPIDTAAVDATSEAAINAYNSIGASQGGGADAGAGSRLGALGGAAVVGQGALNHQNAAASSYYTNMQAFGQALQAQATTDANATATKLNSDVQNVQDVATALEQSLDLLDTQTQLRVKTQLANLKNLIAQYQYAMQNYKDNTKLIHDLAIGILSMGGAIATAATGGLASIGIAAATAATTAAAKR